MELRGTNLPTSDEAEESFLWISEGGLKIQTRFCILLHEICCIVFHARGKFSTENCLHDEEIHERLIRGGKIELCREILKMFVFLLQFLQYIAITLETF